MEAADSFETSLGFLRTTQGYISEKIEKPKSLGNALHCTVWAHCCSLSSVQIGLEIDDDSFWVASPPTEEPQRI
jgi:hypothetical protein